MLQVVSNTSDTCYYYYHLCCYCNCSIIIILLCNNQNVYSLCVASATQRKSEHYAAIWFSDVVKGVWYVCIGIQMAMHSTELILGLEKVGVQYGQSLVVHCS